MLEQIKNVLNGADLSQVDKKQKDDEKKKEEPKDDKTKEVEKALDIYKKLEDAYYSDWKVPLYSMDPAFHDKVAQIREKLRATKTYRDDNYFIDPMSWTWEKQVNQDMADHKEAVERAAEAFELQDMKEHSKVVAEAAQASHDLAPTAKAKDTTVGQMVADHQRQKYIDEQQKLLDEVKKQLKAWDVRGIFSHWQSLLNI